MKRVLSVITPVAGIVNIEPHPDKQPDIYFRCDLSEEIEDATRDYLWEGCWTTPIGPYPLTRKDNTSPGAGVRLFQYCKS
jgi:hypothetical protein